MNRTPVSLLIIASLATLLTAQECPTCHATVKISQSSKKVSSFNANKIKLENSEIVESPQPTILKNVVPLDNNEPSVETENLEIVKTMISSEENNSKQLRLTDATQENLDENHSILEQNIIYACEDSTTTLVCDSQTQMCECV
jgi:transcription initiation factor IIE alpha subunit